MCRRTKKLYLGELNLSISENKSCLEIKFGWAPDYLKQLSWSVSEKRNQGLHKF